MTNKPKRPIIEVCSYFDGKASRLDAFTKTYTLLLKANKGNMKPNRTIALMRERH
jgi:hypothetical protein